MTRQPVVIDFETQKSFREAPNPKDLGISVAGAYDYKSNEYLSYEESDLTDLFTLIENASILIGFNLDSFDLPVLQGYYPGDTSQFATFDMLTDVKQRIGRRIRLDDLVKSTLGEGKSGHGLQAISFYREGKIDELKKYCLDDVRLTKELFEFGAKNREIFYDNAFGRQRIRVNWEQYLDYQGQQDNVNLTLPF